MIWLVHFGGTVAAIIAAVAAWWFVISYRRVNWAVSEHGKHLMSFTLGMAVIFTFVSARAITGSTADKLWLELVRLAVYGWAAVMLVWRASIEHRDNHP